MAAAGAGGAHAASPAALQRAVTRNPVPLGRCPRSSSCLPSRWRMRVRRRHRRRGGAGVGGWGAGGQGWGMEGRGERPPSFLACIAAPPPPSCPTPCTWACLGQMVRWLYLPPWWRGAWGRYVVRWVGIYNLPPWWRGAIPSLAWWEVLLEQALRGTAAALRAALHHPRVVEAAGGPGPPPPPRPAQGAGRGRRHG